MMKYNLKRAVTNKETELIIQTSEPQSRNREFHW